MDERSILAEAARLIGMFDAGEISIKEAIDALMTCGGINTDAARAVLVQLLEVWANEIDPDGVSRTKAVAEVWASHPDLIAFMKGEP